MTRTAIVHYWLLGMRGGEKVVEALCRIFPAADIFTLFYQPEQVSEIIRSHRVIPSFLNPGRRFYRSLLPLMPMALERFDLRGYDLVISSESGPAKGIITSGQTRHICYCHSPMRYLWDLYPDYLLDWTKSQVKRALMMPFCNYLRTWDYCSSVRVDEFIANSKNVSQRIWKAYRRSSQVLHPPVAVHTFYHRPADDYYLAVAELVPYKRMEDVVRCFSNSGRRLKIVGDGPEYRRLRSLAGKSAGKTIEFCGRVSNSDLRELYAHCRAFLQPGEEDFGIAAVEAIASGKPVIGLARGGLMEIVPGNYPKAGFLYPTPGVLGLQRALEQFEKKEHRIDPAAIQAAAARFSEGRFEAEIRNLVFGRQPAEDVSQVEATVESFG
jgi:glycosyltransferase involved in cell wall biosynthesis